MQNYTTKIKQVANAIKTSVYVRRSADYFCCSLANVMIAINQ